MKILEEDLQNMKKRRSKNVAEMTDYDHFMINFTSEHDKISRIGHTIDFPDNKLQKKHAFWTSQD